MASKVMRVSEEALAAASRYSPDLSTAILLMQARLEEREKNQLDMRALEKVIRNAVSIELDALQRGY
ncbi:MAG: hypothetical protein Q4Q04_04830 [Methanocorpusculum sp.]|nr:hypothetical protein [Methanocorpusculum sp.]